MTEAENGNYDLVQGLSEKMKRLLLVSDDLTPSEKATLGAKITPATSLTGNYLHVAEKLRPEADTRKWEVSESSMVHLFVHTLMMVKENRLFELTISQAVAHMLGMQQRDQRIPKPISRKSINTLYGIVSGGTCWTFLRLTGRNLQKSDIVDVRNSSQNIRIHRFLDAIVKASVDSFPQESFKGNAHKSRKKPKRQVRSKEAMATRASQRLLREQAPTLFGGIPAHPRLIMSYKNDGGKTYQDGCWSGYGNGFDKGHSTGYDHGRHDAYDAGYADGYDNGFDNQDSVHSSDKYEDDEGGHRVTQQALYEQQQYEEPYGRRGLEPGESYGPSEAYNEPCDEVNEPYDERYEPHESCDNSYVEPYEDFNEQCYDDHYDQLCVDIYEGDDYGNDHGDNSEDDYGGDHGDDYGNDYEDDCFDCGDDDFEDDCSDYGDEYGDDDGNDY